MKQIFIPKRTLFLMKLSSVTPEAAPASCSSSLSVVAHFDISCVTIATADQSRSRELR